MPTVKVEADIPTASSGSTVGHNSTAGDGCFVEDDPIEVDSSTVAGSTVGTVP